MKKIFIISLFVSSLAAGQDMHFSQFYMAPLSQNPALAGANYDMQAIINYKDQWRNANAPFRTFAVSYDMRTMPKESRGGFLAAGINLVNDRAGSSTMGYTVADLNLAYHVRLDKYNCLGLGIKSGIIQRGVDINSMSFGSQFDGTGYNAGLPSGEMAGMSNFTQFDIGAGVVYTYDNTQWSSSAQRRINVGFSAFHLTQPNFSFFGTDEKLYTKFSVYANAIMGINNTKWAVQPGFLFYRQGPAQEIYTGMLAKVNLGRGRQYVERAEGTSLGFGAYWRAGDAISAQFVVDYGAFTFGLSYDINVSDLQISSNGRGGLEISIGFVNNFLRPKRGGNSRI